MIYQNIIAASFIANLPQQIHFQMKLKQGKVGINGSLALVSQQVCIILLVNLFGGTILNFTNSSSGLDLQRHIEGEHLTWLSDERGLVQPGC